MDSHYKLACKVLVTPSTSSQQSVPENIQGSGNVCKSTQSLGYILEPLKTDWS